MAQSGPKIINLAGERFGRWTVLSLFGRRKTMTLWVCKCDCGIERTVASRNLKNKTSRSCGCLHHEELSVRQRAHGLSNTPEYYCWQDMLQRCNTPSDASYHLYGGRGIKVCERWHKFDNFYADMGRRPANKNSIERIDNNGNYEPENVVWATMKRQARNTRKNRLITYKGVTTCVAAWAEISGIPHERIRTRLKRGWSVESIFETPINQRHRKYEKESTQDSQSQSQGQAPER